MIEGLFLVEIPPERARLMANVVHWAHESGLGAVALAKDLCGHLVYGVGTTAAFRALARA